MVLGRGGCSPSASRPASAPVSAQSLIGITEGNTPYFLIDSGLVRKATLCATPAGTSAQLRYPSTGCRIDAVTVKPTCSLVSGAIQVHRGHKAR